MAASPSVHYLFDSSFLRIRTKLYLFFGVLHFGRSDSHFETHSYYLRTARDNTLFHFEGNAEQ